jgi:hypothetical protein
MRIVLLVVAEQVEDTEANDEEHQGGAEQHLAFVVMQP